MKLIFLNNEGKYPYPNVSHCDYIILVYILLSNKINI